MKHRIFKRLPVASITNRYAWNVRMKRALLANDGPVEGQTGIGSFAREDDAAAGIKKGDPVDGMVLMLRTSGQSTPIDVYPDPEKGEGFFLLADGATRLEAKKMLDERGLEIPKGEAGFIDAWIYPEWTEGDAEDRNLAANAGRRDLRIADFAWGIARSGKRLTDHQIAAMLGYEEKYIGHLHRIVKNAPEVAKLWRDSDLDVGYEDLLAISRLPRHEQIEAWKAIVSKKKAYQDKSNPDGARWLELAMKRAEKAGEALGHLEGLGLVDCSNLDFDANLDDLAKAFGFRLADQRGRRGKEATKPQRGKIAKAAERARDAARYRAQNDIDEELRAEKAGQAGVKRKDWEE